MIEKNELDDLLNNSDSNDKKKYISIKIHSDTIDYFKKISTEMGIPYPKLINSYLSTCIKNNNNLNK